MLLAFASFLVAAVLCSAQEPPVTTRHQIAIQGRTFAYTNEVGRVAIREVETGEPHAYMFYTAYRVGAPGKRRPVTFIWNGGPEWPSLPLHFEVAGPLLGEGDRLVGNPDTWLTESDLVFVDAVGTGFSRATKPEYVKEFAITVGDVMAETEFIRCWLLLHDADLATVVIAGESYGSARAGRVGYALLKRRFNVAGLVLISGGTGLPSFENSRMVDWAMHVADIPVLALYNKKTPPELGSTPDAVRAATEKWVRERYLPALGRIDSLSGGNGIRLQRSWPGIRGSTPTRSIGRSSFCPRRIGLGRFGEWEAAVGLRLPAIRGTGESVDADGHTISAAPALGSNGFAVHRRGWGRDAGPGVRTVREISAEHERAMGAFDDL